MKGKKKNNVEGKRGRGSDVGGGKNKLIRKKKGRCFLGKQRVYSFLAKKGKTTMDSATKYYQDESLDAGVKDDCLE